MAELGISRGLVAGVRESAGSGLAIAHLSWPLILGLVWSRADR